jgi:uncharacterized coiled-coil DUF342 family protein
MQREKNVSPIAESFRESESQNKEFSRSVQELTSIRVQLQSERDSLDTEVRDSRDALKELQARLDAANNVLNQLKIDTDNRLREKDEEIENNRSVHS